MKILLLGGNGQLGHELRRSLAPLGQVIATSRDGRLSNGSAGEVLDLARPGAGADLVERIAPDVVVNAAGYTAVDRAEDDRDLAFRLNADVPGELASACVSAGCTLVHYSTDYVFDGEGRAPYRETDATRPLSVYGESKLAGEHAIAASGARHLILRTAWVYGLRGTNFLTTMLRLGSTRDVLEVVDDQSGSPTPAWWVAEMTAKVLRQGLRTSGIRHLVSAGQESWHGFAGAIFEQAVATGRMDRAPRVVPVSSADFATRATRPAYSVLDSSCLATEYGLALPDWRDALAHTFERGGDRPSV